MKSNRIYTLLFILLGAALVYWICQYRLSGESWKQVVASDGRGYYAYLPAAFIYNDWEWNFVEEAEKAQFGQDFPAGSWLNPAYGGKVNQYFAGTAIMILPFFLLAWAFSPMFGFPADGYSFLFQHAVAAAGVFYFFLGLWWTKKLLESFGFSTRNILLTLLFIGAGTNLFYYAAYEPSMSHVYSFALIAGFCYFIRKLAADYSRRDLLIASVLFGLIVLVRPVNGIILLFVPFLAGGLRGMTVIASRLFSDKRGLAFAFLIFAGICFIQLFTYYLQTGHFFVYSYSSVTFHFGDPHFFDILFSYRKGLFVYTPVLLLGLYGVASYLPAGKARFFYWMIFFVACTYVLSSWEYWWYGGSYGMRAFIEFFPCFAIPLAFLFQNANPWKYVFMLTLGIACLALNFFQMFQYQRGILMGAWMDHEKYWTVFLESDPRYEWALYNEDVDHIMTNRCTHSGDVVFHEMNDFESPKPSWLNTNTRLRFCPAPSGVMVSHISDTVVYSETFAMTADSSYSGGRYSIRASANIFSNLEDGGLLVISIENNGKMKNWHGKKIVTTVLPKVNQWVYVTTVISYDNPEPGDQIRSYVMKEGKGFVNIDNFCVTILKSPR